MVLRFFTLVFVLIAIGCDVNSKSLESTQWQSPLTLTRLAPKERAIRVDPGEVVELVYKVRNVSTASLSNIELQTDCRCQVLQPLPDEIPPQKSVVVKFHVGSARVGKKTYRIPIVARNTNKVLATITGEIETDIEVPYWISPPCSISVKSIFGDEPKQVAVWESLEHAKSPPLVKGLASDVGTIKLETKEQPQPGQSVVLRKYILRFEGGALPMGVHRGELKIEGQEVEDSPLWLTVDVISPLAIVPPKVLLGEEQPIRILVFDRRGYKAPQLVLPSETCDVSQSVSEHGRIRNLELRFDTVPKAPLDIQFKTDDDISGFLEIEVPGKS